MTICLLRHRLQNFCICLNVKYIITSFDCTLSLKLCPIMRQMSVHLFKQHHHYISDQMSDKANETNPLANSSSGDHYWLPNSCTAFSDRQSVDSSGDCSHRSDKKRKRKANPIPVERKDEHYWERRRRNNESAKRSREGRRAKEQQTSARVSHLELENIQLRTEVSTLRHEIAKLREMLYSGRPDRKDAAED